MSAGRRSSWWCRRRASCISVDDIIAAAKADKFSGYASSGVGTLGHLVVEYVAKRHNLKLTHIPYNTAAFARHHRRPRADGLIHLGRGAGSGAGRHLAGACRDH